MASLKPRHSSGKILLDQLTKEVFLQNIDEARKVEGESVEDFVFNKSRCRILSENKHIKEESDGVLYWMYRDCRVQDNWAMIFAQRMAIKQELPLYVCFSIHDARNQYPTQRHFKFLIEGLKLVQEECKELNIKFYLLNYSPKELAKFVTDNNIGVVVCDFCPLKHHVKLQDSLLENLPEDVPLVQVDAHNIVPLWLASEKQEAMAPFLRPKINKSLDEFFTGFPKISEHKYPGKLKVDDMKDLDEAYKFYIPKYDVPYIKWGDGPGPEAGLCALHYFIVENLKHYGNTRNDPVKNNTSKLSIWLNFGHISAQRCALEIKSVESLYKVECDMVLENLIVRRELSDNYCYFNSNYDNISGASNWARETLDAHSQDERPWVYTRKELEMAQTHDEMWNCAQLQAYQEGKIPGYMRMYWGKKILEWTESPEQALEFGFWLNNMFCLDGNHPNSYSGVMWAICGVHDRCFKERGIFGKLRFMVDYCLRKKFDMDAYCDQFGRTILDGSDEQSTSGGSKKKGAKRKAN